MIRVHHTTRRTLAVMTLALASCRGPTHAPTPTPEVVPLYFVTSSNTQPLLRELAAAYSRDHALVAIVDQGSTGVTVEQVLNGQVDSAFQPPPYILTTQLPPDSNFWAAPLGSDAIALIVHPGVRVESLTASHLRAIFTGTADNWSDFGNSNDTIGVVSREAGSPTRQAFEALVMGARSITLRALLATTEAAVVEIVSQTPGAIGYVSLALVTDQVKIVPLRTDENSPPILPSPQSVAENSYPLQMPLLIIGSQPPIPGDGYYEFILWAQQEEGQAIIARHYAPLP